MDLMMTDNKVEMINDCMQAFFLEFHQPKYNPYQEGVWKIRVELPDAYPYKSLSIDFVNKIYSVWFSSMLSNSAVLAVISAQNNTTKKTTPGHAVLAHMDDSVGTTAMMRLDSE